MVGFRGLAVEDDHFIIQDIRERHLGGVVLFDYDIPSGQPVRNVQSPAQLKSLVNSLQAAAQLPLLVAIDHEGGQTTRLTETHGFPATVSHQQLGALQDLERTYAEATLLAKTLAELGINLNLAPVVDLCINPDNPIIARYGRCFSSDPHVTAVHALQFIWAHHAQGIGCTLKHFPGHGSSRGDSHHGLTDVTETWTREELLPYARIIDQGDADAIMTAHVFNAHLDPDYPATLSRATITGLLRDELGYDGLVISDDLQMRAITDEYGFETVIRQAIAAGVDVLAFANNRVYEPDVAARAIGVIQDLVREGAISEERIAESYRRIRALKERLPPG
jgi:beta-N-acetylhexosaminidase